MILEKYKVTCPNYPTEIQVSGSRRAKYWKMGDKLPKKYRDDTIFKWSKDGFLLDGGSNKIIKNAKTAFQPRFLSLNSQSLYSGNVHHSVRAKVVHFLHNYFSELLHEQLPKKIDLAENERIFIYFKHFGDIKERHNGDLDNFNYYFQKCVQDCLGEIREKGKTQKELPHKLGIIPDDTLKHIHCISSQYFNSTVKKLEIILWKVSEGFDLEEVMIQFDNL